MTEQEALNWMEQEKDEWKKFLQIFEAEMERQETEKWKKKVAKQELLDLIDKVKGLLRGNNNEN